MGKPRQKLLFLKRLCIVASLNLQPVNWGACVATHKFASLCPSDRQITRSFFDPLLVEDDSTACTWSNWDQNVFPEGTQGANWKDRNRTQVHRLASLALTAEVLRREIIHDH